jgi:hypothetical protein
MRWLLCGVLAAGCGMPILAGGLKSAKGSNAATCGDYGTTVHFEKTPKIAADKAAKEEKLVFVVHVSGLFENSDFT